MKYVLFLGFFLAQTSFAETVRLKEVPTSPEVIAQIEDLQVEFNQSPPVDAIDPGMIWNIGKEIWNIIVANKPQLDIKRDYGTAIPKGVDLNSGEMAEFSEMQYKSYNLTMENSFGITVVDITFTTIHVYNGTYNGVGRYIAFATIMPSRINVKLGTDTDVAVNKVSAYNVGTTAQPIAGLLMEMSIQVNGILMTDSRSFMFQFRGDSANVAMTEM